MLAIQTFNEPVIASTRMLGSGIMKMKYSTGNQARRSAGTPFSNSKAPATTSGWEANSSTEMPNTRPTK